MIPEYVPAWAQQHGTGSNRNSGNAGIDLHYFARHLSKDLFITTIAEYDADVDTPAISPH
jgi:hypothetical protein